MLIEYKGDDRDNSNSARKLKLGRKWQAQCGQEYRYFMVFKTGDFGIDGAYTLDRFVEIYAGAINSDFIEAESNGVILCTVRKEKIK